MRRWQLTTTFWCGICILLLTAINPAHALPHRPLPLKSWEEMSNYRAIARTDRQIEEFDRREARLRQLVDRLDAMIRLAPEARHLQDERAAVLEDLYFTEEDRRDLESRRAGLVRRVPTWPLPLTAGR